MIPVISVLTLMTDVTASTATFMAINQALLLNLLILYRHMQNILSHETEYILSAEAHSLWAEDVMEKLKCTTAEGFS